MTHILVVEDDDDLRYLYDMMLSRQGYEVDIVESASQAIATLTNQLYDLILLDLNMPGAPGTRLIEFTRDDIRLKNIPIVVISANDRWQKRVLDMGVKHFVVKPVTMQRLIEVTDHILSKNNGGSA
ncbi:MAG: response regulator [Anaerolineae bacterium]|nr:response regulator [Anaerolineae bacterium]